MANKKDKHAPIGKINQFCPEPGTPCKCGNNYQTNCKPKWRDKYQFAIGKTGKESGDWQAHHVLSISCVNWYPRDEEKREALERVLKVTKWCINNKDNMLAMPMFGQTIIYYTDVMTHEYYTKDEVEEKGAPPFANIPQHDFEHNTKGGYCSEVKSDISDLWDQVSEANEEHLESKKGIQDKLVKLSKKWKSDPSTGLLDRGKRENGTHNAWIEAISKPKSTKWYLPFSMGNVAHAEKRAFPWSKRSNNKMRKIRASLRAAGKL